MTNENLRQRLANGEELAYRDAAEAVRGGVSTKAEYLEIVNGAVEGILRNRESMNGGRLFQVLELVREACSRMKDENIADAYDKLGLLVALPTKNTSCAYILGVGATVTRLKEGELSFEGASDYMNIARTALTACVDACVAGLENPGDYNKENDEYKGYAMLLTNIKYACEAMANFDGYGTVGVLERVNKAMEAESERLDPLKTQMAASIIPNIQESITLVQKSIRVTELDAELQPFFDEMYGAVDVVMNPRREDNEIVRVAITRLASYVGSRRTNGAAIGTDLMMETRSVALTMEFQAVQDLDDAVHEALYSAAMSGPDENRILAVEALSASRRDKAVEILRKVGNSCCNDKEDKPDILRAVNDSLRSIRQAKGLGATITPPKNAPAKQLAMRRARL